LFSQKDLEASGLPERTWGPKSARSVFWLLLCASLLAQVLVYGAITRKTVIRSDGVGYYAYLPALFVHRDLHLETLERREFRAGIPTWTGIHRVEGQRVIKYPVGEALLLSPFFLLAWLVAAVGGLGSVFAWPYQVAAACSGAFYFAVGGALTWSLVRERFDRRLATIALLFTAFGTNLFHYASYDAIFSHVYSFCLSAALLWCSGRLAQGSWRLWLLTGLTAGLIAVTRPTNVVLVILVLGLWFAQCGSVAQGLKRFVERWRLVALAVASAALPVLLQMAYWKYASGHFLLYAYGDEGFDFAHPNLLKVLLSVEKGWFIYVPLAAVACFGALAARDKLSGYYPALLLFGLVNLWVIASWHDWGYGGSFATRPFVESSPLFALCLAGAFWSCHAHPNRRRWLTRLALTFTLYTSVLMLGYWLRTLPYSHATARDITRSLTLAWLRR
jgi:hypothetical protein